MSAPDGPSSPTVGTVTVRYWAAARAAAGVEEDVVPLPAGATLADLLAAVRTRHADRPRLAEVLTVCSVLVGERPVGLRRPGRRTAGRGRHRRAAAAVRRRLSGPGPGILAALAWLGPA